MLLWFGSCGGRSALESSRGFGVGVGTLGGTSPTAGVEASGGTAPIISEIVCEAGLTPCDNGTTPRCVDRQSDPSNCGACGNVCKADAPCVDGHCRPLPCEGTVLLGSPPETRTDSVAYAMAIGNLNGDKHLDLVTANRHSDSVSVLIGKGKGTFAASADYATPSEPASVAVGDLNQDGNLDLVVANAGSDAVSVLFNAGDGTFARSFQYPVGKVPISVGVADLNGDLRLDLVSANSESSTVSVLIADDRGALTSRSDYVVGPSPTSVAISDLSHDGKQDLAVVSGEGVSILLGRGGGTCGVAGAVLKISGTSIAIGDLDADGNPDLVLSDDRGMVAVCLGVGDGTFHVDGEFDSGSAAESLAIGDLNGDGRLELVVGDELPTPGSQWFCHRRTVKLHVGTGDGISNISQLSLGTRQFQRRRRVFLWS